jgi:hypothetical protein
MSSRARSLRRTAVTLASLAILTAAFLWPALVTGAPWSFGLSAPVPRYQARLIWLVPLVGAILAFGRTPLTAGGPAPPAPHA